ncbi:hypothetical protein [Fimbriiglobus ruber]|uniref:Uncharacterized protein n=1 Tax=Fimbriiglobus ruber TaxID=1908690 RepID=A0A225D8V4_9BACT|nr:hypothetical protein [Fimbriiglobus ruber]OWK34968.1 hypothetical protein FRUB_09810 [Fimbriiglobus ruber]
MALCNTVTVDQTDLMRSVTLVVRLVGVRRFKIRVWVAIQLLRLAAAVLRVGKVEIELLDEKE